MNRSNMRTIGALGCEMDANTVQVNGLRGLDTFDPYDDWLGALRTQAQQQSLSMAGYQSMIASTLGVAPGDARAAAILDQPQATDVGPADVASPQGAAQIAAAGKRGQMAAALHNGRAQMIEARIHKALDEYSSVFSNPRKKAEAQAVVNANLGALTTERVNAARAAGVAGAARAALNFRKQASATRDSNQKRTLMGLAAASVAVAQQVATVPVDVCCVCEPELYGDGGRGVKVPQMQQLPDGVPLFKAPAISIDSAGIIARLPGPRLNGLGDPSEYKRGVRRYMKHVKQALPVNAVAAHKLAGLGGLGMIPLNIGFNTSGAPPNGGIAPPKTNSGPSINIGPVSIGTDSNGNVTLNANGQQVVNGVTFGTQQVTPPGMTPPVVSKLPSWIVPAAAIGGAGLIYLVTLL
jgi:hypothetical protein